MTRHRESDPLRSTRATLALCAIAPLAACSGETLDLGNNQGPLITESASCDAPIDRAGQVVAFNQADLDRLAGCESLPSLFVVPFENPDFTPLASLVRVEGEVELGQLNLPDDIADEAIDAFFEEGYRLLGSGWIESLEGFEALEQVGNLRLTGLGASSLEPLSNLRRVANGTLEITGCTALRDLAGLENVVGVLDLGLYCESLQSLNGFDFPSVMRSVNVSAPLTDLGAFDTSEVDIIGIRDTALTHLDALGSLRAADGVSVTGNAALVDVRGLDGLVGELALEMTSNDTLATLPDFSNVSGLISLLVVNNPALQNLPAFPRILGSFEQLSALSSSPPPSFSFDVDQVRISLNHSLETVTLPRGLSSGSVVEISANRALRSIGFSDVEDLDELFISDNPALESVDLGALESVERLTLTGNSALSPAAFDGVQVDEATLDGAP